MLRIPYHLRQPGDARVVLYDALGRFVLVLASGEHPAGPHEIGIDTSALASGVYVVVLEADDVRATRRIGIAR